MKVVVIFGDDEAKSDARFRHIVSQVKKRGWECVALADSSVLSEVIAGSSLFSNERLLSVMHAAKVPVKEYQWLATHHEQYDGRLLLYFKSTVPAAIKKLLPKDTVFEEFKLKKELFSIMDMVYPGNFTPVMKTFHTIIKTDPPELVMALLGRHLRDLVLVKAQSKALHLPAWRLQKLERQAKRFTNEQLLLFTHELAEADLKSKTGKGDLVVLIDLAISKYLR